MVYIEVSNVRKDLVSSFIEDIREGWMAVLIDIRHEYISVTFSTLDNIFKLLYNINIIILSYYINLTLSFLFFSILAYSGVMPLKLV